ncbi:MAG: thioredoxin family protein [Planctomycetaceae bacterium]|nr:thioredoxin family protein [Planctomycetaceae bacterium]
MKTSMCRIVAVIALCPAVDQAVADDRAEPPRVGDTTPGWTALTGTDDKQHSLSDLADTKVVVVCFTSNSCPYSVDYEERLVALQTRFEREKLSAQLVAINSNAIPADSLDRMKERASERSFSFPYLRDETQETAKNWGAVYTPEFFVLNSDRKIVYKGAMDDNTEADKVTKSYVDLAVQAALAGTVPETTETGARGCTIRFKRRRR